MTRLVYRWSCIQSHLVLDPDCTCTAGGAGASFAEVHKASDKHTTESPHHATVAGLVPEEEK